MKKLLIIGACLVTTVCADLIGTNGNSIIWSNTNPTNLIATQIVYIKSLQGVLLKQVNTPTNGIPFSLAFSGLGNNTWYNITTASIDIFGVIGDIDGGSTTNIYFYKGKLNPHGNHGVK